tara:strand:- start:262 stop:378 length:117 start_codon:yes stop_codon:yes gene_type:complete
VKKVAVGLAHGLSVCQHSRSLLQTTAFKTPKIKNHMGI